MRPNSNPKYQIKQLKSRKFPKYPKFSQNYRNSNKIQQIAENPKIPKTHKKHKIRKPQNTQNSPKYVLYQPQRSHSSIQTKRKAEIQYPKSQSPAKPEIHKKHKPHKIPNLKHQTQSNTKQTISQTKISNKSKSNSPIKPYESTTQQSANQKTKNK